MTENDRRKFPRRRMKRQVGLLCAGHYIVAESVEIGEGGMTFISEYILNPGDVVVLSFQIPQGDFVFVRSTIKTTQKKDSAALVFHGVIFDNIQFFHKRQIRSFVSDRARLA